MAQTEAGMGIGVFRPSTGKWYLDVNGNGLLDDCALGGCLTLEQKENLSITGDWLGNDALQSGVFDPTSNRWKLDNNDNNGREDCLIGRCQDSFGLSGDYVITGDWDGTGTMRRGVFDPTTGLWELDLNGNGVFDGCGADICLGPFGQKGDLPVVGVW